MMSVLKKNMKKKETTTVITARIPTELYSKLKNYCIQYGLSINEALKLLVENEINSIQNVYKIEEQNDSKVEEKSTAEEKKKLPYSSGVDWDNIPIQDGPDDEDMFDWVTDVDEEGNPVLDENGKEKKIRLIKAEHLYGKVEEPDNTPYDLNDPISRMIWEQEQRYK